LALVGRHGGKAAGKAAGAAIPEEIHQKAASAGVQVHRRSELDLSGKEVLFDNWLTLCAIMTRARSYPAYRETEQLLAVLDRHDELRVSDVLALPEVDPAIMLAVVAKALQIGSVQTELTRHRFGVHSQLKRVRS